MKLKHVMLFESFNDLSREEIRDLEEVGILPSWFSDPESLAEDNPSLEVDNENGTIRDSDYEYVLDFRNRTFTDEEEGTTKSFDDPDLLPFFAVPKGKANLSQTQLDPILNYAAYRVETHRKVRELFNRPEDPDRR